MIRIANFAKQKRATLMMMEVVTESNYLGYLLIYLLKTVTDYVYRGCGECPKEKDPSCECHQCDTELCNTAQGNNANGNNLVGTLAILFVSLVFGNAVMEMMTLI
jgi:hypothetical protein